MFIVERIEILMIKEDKSTEKSCLFFASDYHFEMIALPYISSIVNKEKEVIIITENDLEETIKKLILNLNLEKKKKKEILNIDWKNNNIYKINQIKNAENMDKEFVVFIKGKEKYIQDINKNIENLENNNINIIDCYDINEIEDSISDIAEKYKKILSTSGIKNL